MGRLEIHRQCIGLLRCSMDCVNAVFGQIVCDVIKSAGASVNVDGMVDVLLRQELVDFQMAFFKQPNAFFFRLVWLRTIELT